MKVLKLAERFYKMATEQTIKLAGHTVRFPPGMVKDWITDALEWSGARYEYSPEGSKVHFTGRQFHEFLDYLKTAASEEYVEPEDKKEIDEIIQVVMSQLPQA
jgi:hypothetical protein